MQILIDISERDYATLKDEHSTLQSVAERRAISAIKNGTPFTPAVGHWIDDCPIMTDEGLVRVIRCSRCNERRKDYYGVSKDYCPKCGAKMDKVNANDKRTYDSVHQF